MEEACRQYHCRGVWLPGSHQEHRRHKVSVAWTSRALVAAVSRRRMQLLLCQRIGYCAEAFRQLQVSEGAALPRAALL